MKSQAQVVSVILLTGIAVAVVSTAYFWGIPLIEKSQTTTQVTQAETLMFSIEDAINDVVQHGGQRSISLNLQGELEVSEENNSIIYTITTGEASIATTDWVPLNDENTFGVSGTTQSEFLGQIGSNKDGVLVAKSIPAGADYETVFRLAYRELQNPASCEENVCDGRLVEIKRKGNYIGSSGQREIFVKAGEATAGESLSGGELVVIPIYVTIS